MADPANVFAVDDIRSLTGRDVKPVVATKADLMAAIDRYHRSDDELDELTHTPRRTRGRNEELARVKEIVDDAPIVQVRQPAHHPGHRRTGPPTSTSSRASRNCGCGSASTACCTTSCAPAVDPVRRHQPAEDHGGHRHRRAADPAGRPAVGPAPAARRSTCAWRPCRPSGARRSSCESWTTPRPCSSSSDLGFRRAQLRALGALVHQAVRDAPGHRARPGPASRPRSTRR